MKLKFAAIGLVTCALFSLASSSTVVVEAISHAPAGWTNIRPANGTHVIRLSIGVESDGHEEFERTLQQISDPSQSRYGKYLSQNQAKNLIHPRNESSFAVQEWLMTSGVSKSQILERGQFIDASVTIADAERLLSTRFRVFARDGKEAIGALEYSVPLALRLHITTIQPTTFFETPMFNHLAPSSGAASLDIGTKMEGRSKSAQYECKDLNTPDCLRKLYRMDMGFEEHPNPRSLLGVVGFSKQTAQYSQLSKFLQKYAPHASGANFSVESINGGNNPQGNNYPSGEANLDIQYAVALAHRVPVRFYTTGGENHNFNPDLDISDRKKEHIEPWLQFVSHLLETPDDKLPQVMSISYGVNEQVVPKVYAQKICQMFGQLATRGMSIIVASGDTGPGLSCQSNDGKKSAKFLPAFPATCPYVTAVGGTEGKSPEKASGYSSGGFSEYWNRPDWQDARVAKYLKAIGDKHKKYYNSKGRAFPDVAAQASQYPIFNHDKIEYAGGTSASAPLFASMIALINDSRLKRGKPALGFLNPWLYRIGNQAFTDITEGRSEGCKGTTYDGKPAPKIEGAGWDAAKGWDPVTGLGTPLFNHLKQLALK